MVLVGRPWRLGRPRRRWENNFKIDLRDVGWGMDWIDLTHYTRKDRWRNVANAVMDLLVP